MKPLKLLDLSYSEHPNILRVNLTGAGRLIAAWQRNPRPVPALIIPEGVAVFAFNHVALSRALVRQLFGRSVTVSGSAEIAFLCKQVEGRIVARAYLVSGGEPGNFADEFEFAPPGPMKIVGKATPEKTAALEKMLAVPFQIVLDALSLLSAPESGVQLVDEKIPLNSPAKARQRARKGLPSHYKVLRVS